MVTRLVPMGHYVAIKIGPQFSCPIFFFFFFACPILFNHDNLFSTKIRTNHIFFFFHLIKIFLFNIIYNLNKVVANNH